MEQQIIVLFLDQVKWMGNRRFDSGLSSIINLIVVGYLKIRLVVKNQEINGIIAITREGSTIRCFSNGVQQGSNYTSSTNIYQQRVTVE